jgi:signal transduction histidine kinase
MAAVSAHAEHIEHTVQRAADLNRQLLAFVRREVVRPEIIDLNDVMIDLDDLLRRTVGRDIELVVRLGEDIRSVLVERGHLERVLVNLAVNARDAMADGGILAIETSNIDIDEQAAKLVPDVEPGRYVRLAVSDSGTGMTDATIERAFEPFFTTKVEGGGTGLGLATVFGIISQAGGHTQIDSAPAVGTTVTVWLPATDEIAPA